jgi:pyridoxal biosynthesis lyase PdxS
MARAATATRAPGAASLPTPEAGGANADEPEACAADAAPGLVRMVGNLPVVDYSAGGPAAPAEPILGKYL